MRRKYALVSSRSGDITVIVGVCRKILLKAWDSNKIPRQVRFPILAITDIIAMNSSIITITGNCSHKLGALGVGCGATRGWPAPSVRKAPSSKRVGD